jgi:thiosulfate/3-mercaptopyruvate sulfurtransferase
MNPLISAEELARELASDAPPLVLDARYLGPGTEESAEPVFERGHIPGSRWVNVNVDLSAHPATDPVTGRSVGGRHPLPSREAFTASMQRLGLSSGRPVVVLDGQTSLSAARLWWMLEDAGHPSVRVLDGGFSSWARAGLPTESGPSPVGEPGDFAAGPGRLPVIDADDAAARASAGALWDVRAPERYRGETEPIDPVAGHIPGAGNLPSAANHEADGRFKPVEELAANFEDVAPGHAVYCGSGITAAQSLLAMRVAGLEGVALYAGSWSDWISDPARPVA